MLYQLSYASPIHLETTRQSEGKNADTLLLRTYYGTEIKVSTGLRREQRVTE
jgi:hypothetical protein